MKKSVEKKVTDIAQVMQWLKDAEVYDKYITEAGQGFIDGLITADFTPEWVERDLYLKEKSCRFKLFGKKLF